MFSLTRIHHHKFNTLIVSSITCISSAHSIVASFHTVVALHYGALTMQYCVVTPIALLFWEEFTPGLVVSSGRNGCRYCSILLRVAIEMSAGCADIEIWLTRSLDCHALSLISANRKKVRHIRFWFENTTEVTRLFEIWVASRYNPNSHHHQV